MLLPRFRDPLPDARLESPDREVFDFVRDDCTLHILPPHSKIDEYLKLIDELPEDNMRLGEILVRSGALTQAELDAGSRRAEP
jgi:two-component system chemotaxis sensor kinase CheA